MSKTLEQILGYAPLCGTIQTVKTGIPQPLPDAFLNLKENTIGDSGRYTQVNGTRKTARQVMYGSPSVRRALKNVQSKDVKLIHTFEHIQIPMLTMDRLRNYNDYGIQRQGIDEITRQVQEFKQLYDNLRFATVLQAIANGVVYFSSEGNLLPSSSGAAITVDYGMNSTTNQTAGQDVDGNALITASWATASTDIPSNIRNIKTTAVRRTGYPLKYVFYGKNVPTYLAKNDYVKDYLARNPGKNQEYLDNGEMPSNLFGLTWVPAYDAFYEDSGDTLRNIFGVDRIVFTPEPSLDWWSMMEGTFNVPRSLNIMADAMAAVSNTERVEGMFSYAVPSLDPPGTFNLHCGDTFLPLLKVPDAVFQLEADAA